MDEFSQKTHITHTWYTWPLIENALLGRKISHSNTSTTSIVCCSRLAKVGVVDCKSVNLIQGFMTRLLSVWQLLCSTFSGLLFSRNCGEGWISDNYKRVWFICCKLRGLSFCKCRQSIRTDSHKKYANGLRFVVFLCGNLLTDFTPMLLHWHWSNRIN